MRASDLSTLLERHAKKGNQYHQLHHICPDCLASCECRTLEKGRDGVKRCPGCAVQALVTHVLAPPDVVGDASRRTESSCGASP